MDWLSLIGGAGQLGQGLYGMFGKKNNPADAANKYLNQIPGQTNQYYSPFIQAGQGAMGDLQNQYKDLLGGNVQNQLGANYQESPGYQFKLKQALQGGNAAAAAGGMLGTPSHEQGNMTLANDLASQDYGDYIKNQMGLYGLGIQGNQDIFNKGYGASGDYANTLANTLGAQGQLAYEGQKGKNSANANAWGNTFSGLGMLSQIPGLSELFGGHGQGV